jgi:hypothetical protein
MRMVLDEGNCGWAMPFFLGGLFLIHLLKYTAEHLDSPTATIQTPPYLVGDLSSRKESS